MQDSAQEHLKELIAALESVDEAALLALARGAASGRDDRLGAPGEVCPVLLVPSAPPSLRLGLPLDPDAIAGGDLPADVQLGSLAGAAALCRVGRRLVATFLLLDGRAWQAEITPSGQAENVRFDDAVNDARGRLLRRALGLELVTASPGEVACALWAHACCQVPVSRDPLEHAALTDPLPLIVDASLGRSEGSQGRHELMLERAREGREWLDLDEAGRVLASNGDMLAAFGMRALNLPAGFGRGERTAVQLGRIRAQMPENPLDRAHPSALLVASRAAARLDAWGEPVPQWLRWAI